MELEEVLAYFLRCHPGLIVHYDRAGLLYRYDLNRDVFLYCYDDEDEDDQDWRFCDELNFVFEKRLRHLKNFDHS